jgi:hypothetical protein
MAAWAGVEGAEAGEDEWLEDELAGSMLAVV